MPPSSAVLRHISEHSIVDQGGPHPTPRCRRPRHWRSAVNLQLLVEQYIPFRQTLGERFRTNAVYLRAFGRAVGIDADIAEVRAEQVNAFLAGTGPLTHAWYVR